MIVYKLTDENDRTRGGTQWGENVTHSAVGAGTELCTDGWVHAYEHPLLAVLHDPVHGNFGPSAHLWECETGGELLRDGQMKLGAKSITTLRRIDLPVVSPEQRTTYAILCARAVGADTVPRWTAWADNWLNGTDRSAAAAAWTVKVAAAAAWTTAMRAAAWTVKAAAAQETVMAVETAASAAAWTAAAASKNDPALGLLALAQRAMEVAQ